MSPDPRSLAERVSAETGLEFSGTEGRDGDGSRWLELCPAGHPATQTFTLRTLVGWRRIDVHFRPGSFAGELMEAMGNADETGRKTFQTLLAACRDDGAEIALSINGSLRDPNDDAIWASPWRSLEFSIRRGMLAINQGDAAADMRQIELWSSRAAASVVALLPLQAQDREPVDVPELAGLPEGAKIRVEVTATSGTGATVPPRSPFTAIFARPATSTWANGMGRLRLALSKYITLHRCQRSAPPTSSIQIPISFHCAQTAMRLHTVGLRPSQSMNCAACNGRIELAVPDCVGL